MASDKIFSGSLVYDRKHEEERNGQDHFDYGKEVVVAHQVKDIGRAINVTPTEDGVGKVREFAPNIRPQIVTKNAPMAQLRFVYRKGSLPFEYVANLLNKVDNKGKPVLTTKDHIEFLSNFKGEALGRAIMLLSSAGVNIEKLSRIKQRISGGTNEKPATQTNKTATTPKTAIKVTENEPEVTGLAISTTATEGDKAFVSGMISIAERKERFEAGMKCKIIELTAEEKAAITQRMLKKGKAVVK